jgi:hyperosmotically inducible protein
MKPMKRLLIAFSIGLLSVSGLYADELSGLARQVRHELVMLPYYGVFDNLALKIDGAASREAETIAVQE